MAFVNVLLDPRASRGLSGGYLTRSETIEAVGGDLQVVQVWARAELLKRWTLAYNAMTPARFELIKAFHFNRVGPAATFRLWDWLDHKADEAWLGDTDGAADTFQLRQQYDDGPEAGPGRAVAWRDVVAPHDPAEFPEPALDAGVAVAAPKIFLGDPKGAAVVPPATNLVEQAPSTYTLETDPGTGNGGQLVFDAAPASGKGVYWTGWFHFVARFAADEALRRATFTNVGARAVPGLELREDRL